MGSAGARCAPLQRIIVTSVLPLGCGQILPVSAGIVRYQTMSRSRKALAHMGKHCQENNPGTSQRFKTLPYSEFLRGSLRKLSVLFPWGESTPPSPGRGTEP